MFICSHDFPHSCKRYVFTGNISRRSVTCRLYYGREIYLTTIYYFDSNVSYSKMLSYLLLPRTSVTSADNFSVISSLEKQCIRYEKKIR